MIKAEEIQFITNTNIPLEKPEYLWDLWWNIFDGRKYIEKAEIIEVRKEIYKIYYDIPI